MDNSGSDVRHLYTPAMLAELLRVPVAAIRRWHRKGYIAAVAEVKRLPYFSADEVHAARRLSELLRNGCSLTSIDREMDQLATRFPNVDRPLFDLPIVVEGVRLLIRRGTELSEPGGQLVIEFSADDEDVRQASTAVIAMPVSAKRDFENTRPQVLDDNPASPVELRELARDHEAEGRLAKAADAYRTLMMTGQGNAVDHFALGEVLYRQGEIAAARERFYMAIELDEDFVEARSNLGCVLAELGSDDLAEASFRGALALHDEYADAHFHLAQVLKRRQRQEEALFHWQRFLQLAPETPWADEAKVQLDELALL